MTITRRTISFTLSVLTLATLLMVSSLDSCKKFPDGFLHVTTDTIEALPNRNIQFVGTLSNIGEESITQHGFCWALTSNPTTSDDTTQLGARDSRGSFSSIVTNLPMERRYYVRAYVMTGSGTAYSKEKSFTSPGPDLPTVTTTDVSDITQTSAIGGGEVTDHGGGEVIARGICWGTDLYPTIEENHTTDGDGTGEFTSQMKGLNCFTTYYVRAYATNEVGTSYGIMKDFTTSDCVGALPAVSTSGITSITETSALGGGEVTSEGGSEVIARGICWDFNTGPTLAGNHTVNGSGPGVFYSELGGLLCDTTYYVRAYATNGSGTAYGTQVSFRTRSCSGGLPVVTTSVVTEITDSTASGGGNVTDEGGSLVTARGVCWSTSRSPTVYGSHTEDGSGDGPFTSKMTSLACNTTYYVRAYATNSTGTVYGDELNFTTAECPAGNPRVTTSAISSITRTSAQGGGNVTDSGGDAVTAKGVCWSTDQNPTVSGSHSTDGSGEGSYTSAITGLTCNTTYYVRAYATNEAGTSYGAQVDFTTSDCAAVLPKVTTAAISGVTPTSAKGGGEVTDNGGATVTARGICWSTSEQPTLSDPHSEDGTGEGTFTSDLTGLNCDTTYYVRAYATNEAGTAFGEQVSFRSGTCPVDLPTVTTGGISSIAQTTARGGGQVTDEGGGTVSAKGLCWSTVQNPEVTDDHTTDGSGMGTFTSDLTGLTCNTPYYVRAYATNEAGTNYGDQVSFTTVCCPPTVTTYTITSVTRKTAQGGGTVSSGGGCNITARGICWSTSSGPTVGDDHTTDGSSTGSFTSLLDDLTCNTTYYVRAYVTTSESGTSYGNEVSFQTDPCVVPSVTTAAVTNESASDAEGGGNVTDDGGASVFIRGVCWSTSAPPYYTDEATDDGTGTGSFSSSITGLNPNTTYYLRAYARNSVGTGYGSEVSFTTQSETATVTDKDGNVYQTVTIGSQTWMAENLRVTKYEDNSVIPLVESTSTWDAQSTSSRAYCWYNNSTSYKGTYGGLYTWAAAMKGAATSSANPSGIQGVCPNGWHLPSDAEWIQLTTYLGGASIAGGMLKEEGIAHWDTPNTGATDDYGFKALPGGNRTYSGVFSGLGIGAIFWSTTQQNSTNARVFGLNYGTAEGYHYDDLKRAGFSVRCIKD